MAAEIPEVETQRQKVVCGWLKLKNPAAADDVDDGGDDLKLMSLGMC